MTQINSCTILAAIITLSVGCVEHHDTDASAIGFSQGESSSFLPPLGPIVQTLPDADATLSTSVDIYLITTKHTFWRTYTLPPCTVGERITIAKTEGHCSPEDTTTIEDEDHRILFDIATDSGIGCKGWGEVIAYEDDIGCKWITVRYGGAVSL